MMPKIREILKKTVTVKQLLQFAVAIGVVIFVVDISLVINETWKRYAGVLGTRDSPYAQMIPAECRRSASNATSISMPTYSNLALSADVTRRLFLDTFLIRPFGYIYSLPDSEKKLGFGMRGMPCMGYNFLMILHGKDFRRTDLYVNDAGEIIASVTYEVIKPYRNPLPREQWISSWNEVSTPPANDASLVTIGIDNRKK